MLQELKITIRNRENVGTLSQEDVLKISEIVSALVNSGGLTGVKGGSTIIHFDANGEFMGVQLSYWPFRRRSREQTR